MGRPCRSFTPQYLLSFSDRTFPRARCFRRQSPSSSLGPQHGSHLLRISQRFAPSRHSPLSLSVACANALPTSPASHPPTPPLDLSSPPARPSLLPLSPRQVRSRGTLINSVNSPSSLRHQPIPPPRMGCTPSATLSSTRGYSIPSTTHRSGEDTRVSRSRASYVIKLMWLSLSGGLLCLSLA